MHGQDVTVDALRQQAGETAQFAGDDAGAV
jgi:hypothetical protein